MARTRQARPFRWSPRTPTPPPGTSREAEWSVKTAATAASCLSMFRSMGISSTFLVLVLVLFVLVLLLSSSSCPTTTGAQLSPVVPDPHVPSELVSESKPKSWTTLLSSLVAQAAELLPTNRLSRAALAPKPLMLEVATTV